MRSVPIRIRVAGAFALAMAVVLAAHELVRLLEPQLASGACARSRSASPRRRPERARAPAGELPCRDEQSRLHRARRGIRTASGPGRHCPRRDAATRTRLDPESGRAPECEARDGLRRPTERAGSRRALATSRNTDRARWAGSRARRRDDISRSRRDALQPARRAAHRRSHRARARDHRGLPARGLLASSGRGDETPRRCDLRRDAWREAARPDDRRRGGAARPDAELDARAPRGGPPARA